ncbi:hypothetical protein [Psychrobacter sp. S1-30-MNA-CIBAN-0213]|uniref:hypothetical protein n=1 Tax=unclassified Psychrobacter TaxID=196806 RepID=UPI00332B1FCF
MKIIQIVLFTGLLSVLSGCTTLNASGERSGYHLDPSGGGGPPISGSAAGCINPSGTCS